MKAKSSEKSAIIYNNTLKKRLEYIFHLLDSDGDGLISATKIEIKNLSTTILESFSPLLLEME